MQPPQTLKERKYRKHRRTGKTKVQQSGGVPRSPQREPETGPLEDVVPRQGPREQPEHGACALECYSDDQMATSPMPVLDLGEESQHEDEDEVEDDI